MRCLLAVLLVVVSVSTAYAKGSNECLLGTERIVEAWSLYHNCEPSVSKVVSIAESILAKPNPSVVQKEICRSGDRHNYESMAIYYWPNESDPTGTYVVRDGVANPEYGKLDGARIFGLNYALRDLCVAYYMTRDERFAGKFFSMLRTWFVDRETRMNPHMTYGQYIPGRKLQGNVGFVSEALNFFEILEYYTLMQECGYSDAKLNKGLRNWFTLFSYWMEDSPEGQKACAVTDNLGIDYDLILYRIGVFTGQKGVCKAILSEFAEKRIEKHIADDGSQPLELKRTKAMYYSLYNLQHIVDFCCMAERSDGHYYEKNGGRIERAMNFLLQYVGHKEKFPYKEIGEWKSLEKQAMRLKKRCDELKAGAPSKP